MNKLIKLTIGTRLKKSKSYLFLLQKVNKAKLAKSKQ